MLQGGTRVGFVASVGANKAKTDFLSPGIRSIEHKHLLLRDIRSGGETTVGPIHSNTSNTASNSIQHFHLIHTSLKTILLQNDNSNKWPLQRGRQKEHTMAEPYFT